MFASVSSLGCITAKTAPNGSATTAKRPAGMSIGPKRDARRPPAFTFSTAASVSSTAK